MAFITLKRTPVANVPGAPLPYTVTVVQYDTQARRRYQDAIQASTNTGANAPFELAVGALVATFCVGSVQRQVKYSGGGNISTVDVPGAPACASSLANLVLTNSGMAPAYKHNAQLTATWSGAVGPVTIRISLIAPGTPDAAPLYEERILAAGTTTAQFPAVLGQETLITPLYDGRDGRGPRLTTYNPNTGLGPGRYRVEVTEDLTSYTIGEEITVGIGLGLDVETVVIYGPLGQVGGAQTVTAYGALTLIEQYDGNGLSRLRIRPTTPGDTLLRLYIEKQPGGNGNLGFLRLLATYYRPGTGQIFVSNPDPAFFIPGYYNTNNGSTLGQETQNVLFTLSAGTIVDASNSVPVVSNGQGGVTRLAYAPGERLSLDNLILFPPPKPGQATGGVIAEVRSSFPADVASPLIFELQSPQGVPLQPTNSTGRFDGLLAAAYQIAVYGTVTPLIIPFELKAEYGHWRTHTFPDLKNGAPCRLELWALGYKGSPTTICGQPEPVTISTEGLTGGENQNDLGPSIGSSMTMRLRAQRGELQETVISDRACRADFYYNDALRFTGFVQLEIWEEPLASGTINVELTATCGLGSLKEVTFQGHIGQELRGRRVVLNTLLHCLSRTGLSLPLYIYTNRRPLELSTAEQPETALFTDRLAYADKDARSVIDALCQMLGGTLVQRGGTWMLISPLEAAAPNTGRLYDYAGTGGSLDTLPSPTGRIVQGSKAYDIFTTPPQPSRVWYWLKESNQSMQRRAGWKYLTATADAGFAENAFRQGEYFSEPDVWDDSRTVMRDEAGWQAGPRTPSGAVPSFPLALVEAGEKDSEVATSWPLASSATDGRYFESELAPIAGGREGLAFEISVDAKFLARPAQTASLWVEIVADRGFLGTVSMGAVLEFKAVENLAAGFTTAKATIAFGVLPLATAARVRVHTYTVSPVYRARTGATGPDNYLLLKNVAMQVLPQGAKWDGKTAFVATGTGGSVRPANMEVLHVDAPDRAGLFQGTAHAFRNTVTHGPTNPTTAWARADDLLPSSLLAANVLDVLAFRANPSRLLIGTVRHLGQPPEPLDSVDAPFDINGRRWCVGSRSWHVKSAKTDVTVIEIGAGEVIVPLPPLPSGLRIIDGLSQGQPRYRATDQGLRIVLTT